MAAIPGDTGDDVALMTRRALIAGGAMAAVGAAAIALPQRARDEVRPIGLGAIVPQVFAGWRNDPGLMPVLPNEDETQSVSRAYEETVSRFYRRDDGAVVMLVVAHGRPDSGMLAIHRPATCYTAQGFTVTNPREVRLPAPFGQVMAEELFASRGDRHEPILSWVTIGGRQTGFGVTQKLEQLRAAWRGEQADAILVRASTIGPDLTENYQLLDRFMVEMLRQLTSPQRRLIAGVA